MSREDVSPMDFRGEARKHLAQAQKFMDAKDGLIYAALHLRMAIESLTYERTQTYREFLPPEQIDAWQPRRVLEALLEMDPGLNTGATLYAGLESVSGQPADHVELLGTETVLSLQVIKKHYDALGSLLHMPTLKQLRQGAHANHDSLRKRCSDVIEALSAVLSSRISNLTMSFPTEFDCHRCGKPIFRKRPVGPIDYVITCIVCDAQYTIKGKNNTAEIDPLNVKIQCRGESCDAPYDLWFADLKPGFFWECERCGLRHEIASAVVTPEPLRDGEKMKPALLFRSIKTVSLQDSSRQVKPQN